jgi:hypothetical protein
VVVSRLGPRFRRHTGIVFPGDSRKLMDKRRSGVVEAIAGGTEAVGLTAKLVNAIGRSNALHKAYARVEVEAFARPIMPGYRAGARRSAASGKGPKV